MKKSNKELKKRNKKRRKKAQIKLKYNLKKDKNLRLNTKVRRMIILHLCYKIMILKIVGVI